VSGAEGKGAGCLRAARTAWREEEAECLPVCHGWSITDRPGGVKPSSKQIAESRRGHRMISPIRPQRIAVAHANWFEMSFSNE
jgi:hypothetical protein